MRIALRTNAPDGIAVHIEPARALPLDWPRWRDSLLGGPPLEPIVESFTVPEGWSVTIGEVAAGAQVRVHAFYAVFDLAVHVWAAAPDAEAREHLRAAFRQAAPVWEDDVVALGDL